jgi:large subunit ribosomal protein L20
MGYSRFMFGLSQQNVLLNRKVISELAMTEPFSFKALVDQVRFMRGAQGSETASKASSR